jgi:hypothetical protein
VDIHFTIRFKTLHFATIIGPNVAPVDKEGPYQSNLSSVASILRS